MVKKDKPIDMKNIEWGRGWGSRRKTGKGGTSLFKKKRFVS
jgi:hypothetical protein